MGWIFKMVSSRAPFPSQPIRCEYRRAQLPGDFAVVTEGPRQLTLKYRDHLDGPSRRKELSVADGKGSQTWSTAMTGWAVTGLAVEKGRLKPKSTQGTAVVSICQQPVWAWAGHFPRLRVTALPSQLLNLGFTIPWAKRLSQLVQTSISTKPQD